MAASGRGLKKEVSRKLGELPLDELLKFSDQHSAQAMVHGLFSCLCSSREKVRWLAISVFGHVMARLADEDMERARIVMRRFMWMLNDESGGIGWGVPEAFAESVACHERLAQEYIHMLVSYMREEGFFLELEELQRGLMWGVGRAAQKRRILLLEKNAVVHLLPYLDSKDAAVRGLASWASGNLWAQESEEKIRALLNDAAEVRFYEQGRFSTVTVGQCAAQALQRIEQSKHI
jgi:hypothetical protein